MLCFVNVFCSHQQLIYVLEPGPDLKRVSRLLALFCIPSRLKAMLPETTLISLCNQHVGDMKAEVALKQLGDNWPPKFKSLHTASLLYDVVGEDS